MWCMHSGNPVDTKDRMHTRSDDYFLILLASRARKSTKSRIVYPSSRHKHHARSRRTPSFSSSDKNLRFTVCTPDETCRPNGLFTLWNIVPNKVSLTLTHIGFCYDQSKVSEIRSALQSSPMSVESHLLESSAPSILIVASSNINPSV